MARRSKIDKATKLNRDIARWEHKQEGAVIMLRKSAEMLVKLRRQRHRMLERETRRRLDEPTSGELVRATDSVPAAAPVETKPKTLSKSCDAIASAMVQGESFEQAAAKDDGIPSYLRRQPREFDPYKGERDAATKEKAKAKREANKQRAAADATGERAKMPLTGKAALAAIRGKRKRITTLADA
jgi:hypothetical protein